MFSECLATMEVLEGDLKVSRTHRKEKDGVKHKKKRRPRSGVRNRRTRIRLPTAMPQASSIARRGEDLVLVGGTVVGGAPADKSQRRRNGERSVDKGKRASRRCKNCLKWGKAEEEAQSCIGRGPRGTCPLSPFGTGAGDE